MALLATKDYQLVVQTKVISNIANMYYTLLMLDKQLQVVENMTKLTEETLRIMSCRRTSDVCARHQCRVQSRTSTRFRLRAQR